MEEHNYTKLNLIDMTAEKEDMPVIHTKRVINRFIDTIKQEVLKGNTVSIRGFGTFELNPKKNEIMFITTKNLNEK